MANSIIDRPIYNVINYVYAFLVTNFYFFLANSVFVFAFYFVEFTIENILLFYIALLPFGPSVTALLATMDKLVKDKIIQPTKDYWHFYRSNFKVTMKYWLIQWSVITILIVDIHYGNLYFPLLSPIFLVFILLNVAIMLYALPLITRFEVKIKNLFLVSFYANFRFIKTTILNMTTIVALGVIYYAVPSIFILFLMSITCFFIMFNIQRPLEQMEIDLSTSK